MRSGCAEYGRMLHAYELRILPPEERQAFEQHFLHCDACFKALDELSAATRQLREDPEVHSHLGALAAAPADPSPRRFPKRNWQRWSPGFKSVIAAGLILLLWIPVSIWRTTNEVRQRVDLYAIRGESAAVLDASLGGQAELRFICGAANAHAATRLIIRRFSGPKVYEDLRFEGFDLGGVGHLLVPIDVLRAGDHRLVVESQDGRPLCEFLLVVE